MSQRRGIMNFLSQQTVSVLTVTVLVGSSFIGIFSANAAHDACRDILESFAGVTANFTNCTIVNARPITVCTSCVESYIEVLDRYQAISKLHNDGGTLCKLELINVDRLEVVEASYSFVLNQWNRASCNHCFQNKSGNITPEKNNYTEEILKEADALDECIRDNTNNDTNSTVNLQICTNCASQYQQLNLCYNDNKVKVFCMDIVDRINSTRSSWSQEFGCCSEREQPELLFLVTTSAFCFTPLVFYLLVRLCSVKHLLPILPSKRWDQYLTASSSTTDLIQS